MPRMKRLDLPGVAQHVVQRGHARQPCFFREADYASYLQDLREAALKYDCQVHAYVLMVNHVHLLVTSQEEGALGRMMQTIGRCYVRRVNKALSRTGTLWEGRYKSSLIDSECYVIACYRHIELNPVRAGLVDAPDLYRWSSFAANGYGARDLLVTPHDAYSELAADEASRCARYRSFVAEPAAEEEVIAIRLYLQRQRALGSARFQAEVERKLQRRAGLGRPGRPRRASVL
jgi:putative transposase